MKKFIAITLMAIMLVAVASTASAISVNNPTTFSIYVNSKDSSAAYTDEENETRKTSSVRAIYVKHWVTGGSSEYTNHFRGRKTPTYHGTRTNCGAKWCTVGQNVPIESTSIVSGAYYSISGRGNTNHYDYDGVSNVTLHGNMYINATN